MSSPLPSPVHPPDSVISVWPDQKMPGHATVNPEKLEQGDKIEIIHDVSHPTLTIFQAPNQTQSAPAIIVCPGGGYGILAYDLEGTEIAAWLNSIGITALVLKYRVPDNKDGAFQDIQRAVRLTRSRAQEWKIDPNRLGVLGFSAGGHLCARLSSNFKDPAYPAIDGADQLSCRPDFVVLVYPAYLQVDGKIAPELNLKEKIPPTLIIHNEDDANFVPGSKIYAAALEQEKIEVEFKLYKTGGHGYGLRSDKEVSAWPKDTAEWLRKNGFLRE